MPGRRRSQPNAAEGIWPIISLTGRSSDLLAPGGRFFWFQALAECAAILRLIVMRKA